MVSKFLCILILLSSASVLGADVPEGFTSLFNGRDFTGWRVPEGDGGHWQVIEGVIDYDAESQAREKHLWTEEAFGDFVLMLDWRMTATPFVNHVPLIKPDGSHKRDEEGEEIRVALPDSDSGIYLRGSSKSQINIWSWPIGSGEVWGYRTDGNMPAEVRAGATPLRAADKDIGKWNTFVLTMKGEYLTVVLNGITAIDEAHLPGIPERGPLALQHHGRRNADGEWVSPPSLVQFRNLFIREL